MIRRKARPLSRAAQLELQRAHPLEPGGPALTRADQWMAEQRDQRHRRHRLGDRFGDEQQHTPRRGLRQGAPRGVVGLDVPPRKVRDHPPGQAAVGRDQCGAFFRRFQSLAQQQRDRLRFVLGVGRGHHPHAREPAFLGRQLRPDAACLGRQEQAGDCAAALGRPARKPGAMPGLHLAAVHPHAIEQQLEVILRMRHRIGFAERGVILVLRRARYTQFVPHLRRQRQVEIGQHHRALRQARHRFQQPREQRRRAGHARGDDRLLRRRAAPFLRRHAEQPVAPVGRIDLAARHQLGEPAILHHHEQAQPAFPVIAHLADEAEHAILHQLLGPDLLDQQPVHRLRHLLGKPQRRSAGEPLAGFLADDRREAQPAERRIDRRRNVARRAERVE